MWSLGLGLRAKNLILGPRLRVLGLDLDPDRSQSVTLGTVSSGLVLVLIAKDLGLRPRS